VLAAGALGEITALPHNFKLDLQRERRKWRGEERKENE